MKKILIFLMLLLIVLSTSCEMDPENYIRIAIINNTSEDLSVSPGGIISISTTIRKNSSGVIMGVKGYTVTATGKVTRKEYERKFYFDAEWSIP